MSSEENQTCPIEFALPMPAGGPLSDPARRGADRIGYDMAATEESLVIDARFALSPAQVVETKLSRVLKEATLPVSHLQMRGLLRSR